MKRLKDSTIKSYSAKQLAKHLDRLMDLYKSNAPYRIDFAYNTIYAFERGFDSVGNITNGSYKAFSTINEWDKLLIKDAIYNQYARLGMLEMPGGTNIDNRIFTLMLLIRRYTHEVT